ncbi:hypothetical protein RFI_12134 [Reticulomyxa filosa]|uniref:DNA polymerase zeta catalytic subunit n=1 Tax=Reticulomyxa filosa TaxID=46433 RepID=X6NFB6_RETFI|nr:hypothetical protein RFI_12134 [Reticulomyxa filosa]|eukprot:ETO25010.1 hypothetical protein RFI_12134 [Reticulomyxa filosa]
MKQSKEAMRTLHEENEGKGQKEQLRTNKRNGEEEEEKEKDDEEGKKLSNTSASTVQQNGVLSEHSQDILSQPTIDPRGLVEATTAAAGACMESTQYRYIKHMEKQRQDSQGNNPMNQLVQELHAMDSPLRRARAQNVPHSKLNVTAFNTLPWQVSKFSAILCYICIYIYVYVYVYIFVFFLKKKKQNKTKILCSSRKDLSPDPSFDAVLAVAITIAHNEEIIQNTILLKSSPEHHQLSPNHPKKISKKKKVTRNNNHILRVLSKRVGEKVELISFTEEEKLLSAFVDVIRFWDPDILIGWEIEKQSIGYLIDRGKQMGMKTIVDEIGRIRGCGPKAGKQIRKRRKEGAKDSETEEKAKVSEVEVAGRIVLNLWRCMRREIKLNTYTRENVTFHLLNGERVPHYGVEQMCHWYHEDSVTGDHRKLKVLRFLLRYSVNNVLMVQEVDLVDRTSEMARVIGIDFASVLSRGSQFRVESLLLRIAKPLGYAMISPSREQVANQPAMEVLLFFFFFGVCVYMFRRREEKVLLTYLIPPPSPPKKKCIPLVMEPESRVYTDPVIVLDFQSLYPSIMMAYNICYSTCLGRVSDPLPTQLGVSSYTCLYLGTLIRSCLDRCDKDDVAKAVRDKVWISPNGVMFLKRHVRPGVVCRMLEELLQTRVMTKDIMQQVRGDKKTCSI